MFLTNNSFSQCDDQDLLDTYGESDSECEPESNKNDSGRLSFSGNSSDEEDDEEDDEETEGAFLSEYNPISVESDDAEGQCCHWSKENHSDLNTNIQVHSTSPEYSKPLVKLEVNSWIHNFVELVVDDNFIDISIEANNGHAANDRSFQKYIRKLEKNDKGRVLDKRILSNQVALGIARLQSKRVGVE